MKFLKHKFRQVKKLPTWLFFFPALLLKTFKVLIRSEIKDPHGYFKDPYTVVSVTWHNRLLLFPALFPKKIRQRTVAVVSASRDGQYLVDLLSYFSLKCIRGSSSRRGPQVLQNAIDSIKDEYNVSFTPDGPRGPKYKLSKGPVYLASVTNKKIIPISINASSYWELKSWDRFQIPKPWAKITLELGEAIEIPPDLNEEEIEKWRLKVEDALMKITSDKEQ